MNNHVENPDYYNGLFKKQTQIKGFQYAVCSMFRTELVGNYIEDYISVDSYSIPFEIVYGENDTVIGLDNIEILKRKTHNIKFISVKDAGHSAHVEKRSKVDRLLFEFASRAASVK